MPTTTDINHIALLYCAATGADIDNPAIFNRAFTKFKNAKSLPSDDDIIKLAKLAKWDPKEWLIRINMVRSEGEARELYEDLLYRYLKGAKRPDMGFTQGPKHTSGEAA